MPCWLDLLATQCNDRTIHVRVSHRTLLVEVTVDHRHESVELRVVLDDQCDVVLVDRVRFWLLRPEYRRRQQLHLVHVALCEHHVVADEVVEVRHICSAAFGGRDPARFSTSELFW